MDDNRLIKQQMITPELYFLIAKFLAASGLETGKVLIDELERNEILPKRLDWTGKEHHQTFQELNRKYPHISPTHLAEICCRIPTILDKELVPSVAGIMSLLGAGRQSLLRTPESTYRSPSLTDYCTRIRSQPLDDPINKKPVHNMIRVLYGRESAGPINRKLVVPTSFYAKQDLLRRTLGHLSAVYCVLFDRTGRYIMTGADDLLVKLWSAIDGRLLMTFRGASAEITDIAINLENTLLAAGSLDRVLRVWDLQTAAPIAVLTGHTGMITSVNFCPSPKNQFKFLVTTSTDGSVAFWHYIPGKGSRSFANKPIQYLEKIRPGTAQMLCASFSPGGIFLAAGSADHHVRVYQMSLEEGPKRILEIECHSDNVDSLQWAHSGLRFISGSKDGTALVWNYEQQQWKYMTLNMNERLPTCPVPVDESKKQRVTMVSWDFTDNWVITAVSDSTIKIWNARTGKLHKVLRGHSDDIYVLESHPKDPHVLLSAGHDGQLFIWDIYEGVAITNFTNHIDGQGHGGIFDAKWSPDGTQIAATDSHGHILMYGVGTGHELLKILPKELFFHTDYRPLIRDSSYHVLDEQTQISPFAMPPPFLVDVDGNPYPAAMQRLVPGREHCTDDQLVPNVAIGQEGVEVIEGTAAARSELDRLIEALLQRQQRAGGQAAALAAATAAAATVPDSNNDRDANRPSTSNTTSPRSLQVGSSRMVLRRSVSSATSDTNLRRQSVTSNRGTQDTPSTAHQDDCDKLKRVYVNPMRKSMMDSIRVKVNYASEKELEAYRREMRRRPIMINTAKPNTAHMMKKTAAGRGRGRQAGSYRRSAAAGSQEPTPAYRTRAVRDREVVDDDPEQATSSASSSSGDDSTVAEDDMNMSGDSSSTDTDSSDYSDWVADEPGQNLEPPKRCKRKPVERRSYSPVPVPAVLTPPVDENLPGPSSAVTAAPAPVGRPPGGSKNKINIPKGGEIPEMYRPPEWLSEVIPRKAPYYPQMGDEVMYLRQGHQRYLEAIRSKTVYDLGNKCEPWLQVALREHELCKVIGIKYEIKPPRLCCLKLALMNEDGRQTGPTFTIKYHDMPDVLDFLVLRQTFDMAVSRNWGPDDRFRCMIDDCWWMGQIVAHTALSADDFPFSLFMCFKVRWDNGEYEFMSPWDLEPIDEQRLPTEVGGAVQVLPEEINATLYQPKPEEWPRGDRDGSCRRIIVGLEQVMGLAIADAFLAPVDLNIYPAYAFVVEYPIDLNTIKARFDNHFYRRITSAQFDVRYLATNAEKFNQSHSNIVKHARIVTDLCLRILRDQGEIDVQAVYHQLVDTYISSESENEQSNDAGPSTSGGATASGTRRSRRLEPEAVDWRVECRELLDIMWQSDDSSPFREPVDTLEHPDYLQIVDTPMDLRTIKEDLLGSNYETPITFSKDVRLIFQNSRNYNTNKRSRIYAMTLRLSTLFEAHIKSIIFNWKSARRRKNGKNAGSDTKSARHHKKSGRPQKPDKPTSHDNGGPSTSSGHRYNNEETDDDDDDDDDHRPSGGGGAAVSDRRRARNGGGGGSGGAGTSRDDSAGPSTGRRRGQKPRRYMQDEEHTAEDSTSSSSDTSDDSEDNGIPISALGTSSQVKRNKDPDDCDSGDSYKPYKQNKISPRKKPKQKRKKYHKKNLVSSTKKNKRPGRPARRPEQQRRSATARREQEREEHDEAEEEEELGRGRRQGGRKRKMQSESDNAPGSDNATVGGDDIEQDVDVEEDDDDDSRTGKRHRRRAYESDQSFHLDRNAVLPNLASDSDLPTRGTRGNTRRAMLAWGQPEDSLESPDQEQGHQSTSRATSNPRRRGGRRKKVISDSEQSSEQERPSVNQRSERSRLQRVTRNLRQFDEEEETAGSSPGRQQGEIDPLSLPRTSGARSRRRIQNDTVTTNGVNSFTRSHRVISAAATSTALPNTATSASAGGTSSRHYSNRRSAYEDAPQTRQLSHHDDHNYGESSRSLTVASTSTPVITRRILSRHQRNADELDQLDDERRNNPLPNRLRNRNHSITSTSASSTPVTLPPTPAPESSFRRIQPSRHQTSNRSEEEPEISYHRRGSRSAIQLPQQPTTTEATEEESESEEDEEEEEEEEETTKVGTAATTSSDDSDEVPLSQHVAPASPQKNTRQRGLRTNRNYADSDDQAPGPSTGRSTRNVNKRPHYTENDDSDDNLTLNHHLNKKQRAMLPTRRTSATPVATSSAVYQPHPRDTRFGGADAAAASSSATNQLSPQPNSNNNSMDNTNSDSELNGNSVSISSRGRVRKISAKARGLFRE